MKPRRIKAPHGKQDRAYRQLWRVVDGAVLDCVAHHPEYFDQRRIRVIRTSICKRVTGAVIGYAVQTAQGRSGVSPAAVREPGASNAPPAEIRQGSTSTDRRGAAHSSPWRAAAIRLLRAIFWRSA